MQNVMDAATSLHGFEYLEEKDWPDAAPKDKVFTSPQVNSQQVSEGQTETVPLCLQSSEFLQLYPHFSSG